MSLLLALLLQAVAVIAATNATNPFLWSTYAPQLYFGIKPALPHSLSAGLMWYGLNDWEGLQRFHHTSSSSNPSNGGLQSYTYTSYIPTLGNTQTLKDSRNGLTLNTAFVNLPQSAELAPGWGARVEVVTDHGLERISGFWYIALEGEGSLRLVEQENGEDGLQSPIVLLGQTPDLGPFRIILTDHDENEPIADGLKSELFENRIGKTSWVGLRAPVNDLWKAKDIILSLINSSAQKIVAKFATSNPPQAIDLPDVAYTLGMNLPNEHQGPFGNNFYAFQKSWRGNGGWDVLYESGDFTENDDDDDEFISEESKRPVITQALTHLADVFAQHFQHTLPLPEPYASPAHTAFAQEITSNLLGGVGYFHGRSLIDRSFAHEYDEQPEYDEGEEGVRETDERELLTATPSRSFFPRGFYWDEGFHLALIGEWDQDLSLAILKSWVDLIDEDGWVGREQILGEEARSKVPSEFQVQYPTYANPPTLTMALTSFISRLKSAESTAAFESQLGLRSQQNLPTGSTPRTSRYLTSPLDAREYLLSVYPALRRHYHWFRRTQRGQLKEWGRKPPSRIEAYRWRGRTEKHVLTSGLDDYPRASPPSVGELHVDLMSWMAFFARTMREIAEYLGEEEDEDEYARNEKNILANLDALHWSEEDEMYCDVTVDDDDDSIPVCHAGYVSLFPLFLGLLSPDSPKLGPVFDLLRDPEKLWSPYGIRSLSKDHEAFGTGEDYWRSPVWMPFQFLTLQSLYNIYMPIKGPYQETAKQIYKELRDNLITNVFNEYQRTGYVWEQYNSLTGQGARSHPFTGWTSLIANIMAEKY